MLTTSHKPNRGSDQRARTLAFASWVLVAGTLALMTWLGLSTSANEFVHDAQAADRIQNLWRFHGWAAAALFVCWLPFALSWRILPVAASGICTLGTLLAVFGAPFFRDTNLVWVYWTATAILAVCALIQLAVRFPRSQADGATGY